MLRMYCDTILRCRDHTVSMALPVPCGIHYTLDTTNLRHTALQCAGIYPALIVPRISHHRAAGRATFAEGSPSAPGRGPAGHTGRGGMVAACHAPYGALPGHP